MSSAYVIRTPENVTFEFELAGVASRALAWLIDVLVMFVLIATAIQVLGSFMPVAGGLAAAVILVAVFLVQWWYTALLEWLWGGQTIGKRIVGLRTLSERGVRIDFTQSVVRNLVRIVDLLPAVYLTGGVSALLDPHQREVALAIPGVADALGAALDPLFVGSAIAAGLTLLTVLAHPRDVREHSDSLAPAK